MDTKLLLLSFAICFALINVSEAKHKLVAYWGQNAVYNLKKEKQYWEKDLSHFCHSSNYDVIVLAFMHVFFERRQKDNMPGLNFAFHCTKPMSAEYPYLLRCPKIEAGIKECQRVGKKVLLSLGGATGSYGFNSDKEATSFADRVWNLVLGGDKLRDIRPFGSAVLDGVDLDIEGGSHVGYTQFVRSLRTLTNSDNSKKYIIAAAPQCPFPDYYLGPAPGKAFGDVPELFDEIYIQFYNNYCQTGDAAQFYPNFKSWIDFSKKSNGPMIYIGVPSHDAAAFGRGYWRAPAELAVIYQKVKDEPRFGGFMFWDASFDQNNVINGRRYSEHVGAIIDGGGPRTTGQTVTFPRTTGQTVTLPPEPATTKSSQKPTTQGTPVPTKPASLSCVGLTDGIYAHPTDCSKFFLCSHSMFFVQSCPTGLKFNGEKKYCDWQSNVTC